MEVTNFLFFSSVDRFISIDRMLMFSKFVFRKKEKINVGGCDGVIEPNGWNALYFDKYNYYYYLAEG